MENKDVGIHEQRRSPDEVGKGHGSSSGMGKSSSGDIAK